MSILGILIPSAAIYVVGWMGLLGLLMTGVVVWISHDLKKLQPTEEYKKQNHETD